MPPVQCNHHTTHIMGAVAKLYKDVQFIDCVLDTEGGLIHGHKTILAACSPYLKNLFMKFHGMQIIPLKEVHLNDMKHILNFIYFGEVDVPDADMASFMATAKVLEITLSICTSMCVSEEISQKDTSEGSKSNSGVNPKRDDERDMSQCCERVISNPDDQQLKVSIHNTSTIEDTSRDQGDESTPFTFVSVSPASVNSEEHDDQLSASCDGDSLCQNPLGYANFSDLSCVMNVKEKKDCQCESQIKMEIQEGIDDLGLDINITGIRNSFSKVIEKCPRSDITIVNEMKHPCDQLATTSGGNMSVAMDHAWGVQNNQKTLCDRRMYAVNSERCVFETKGDLQVDFESICDISESDLKTEKLCETSQVVKDYNNEFSSLKQETGVIFGDKYLSVIDCQQDMNQGLPIANTEKMETSKAGVILNVMKTPDLVENGSVYADSIKSLGSPVKSAKPSQKDVGMENQNRLKCVRCSRIFISKQSGKGPCYSYSTNDTTENARSCSSCMPTSGQKDHTTIRMRTDDKRYNCGTCKASFRRRDSLKIHMCTHCRHTICVE